MEKLHLGCGERYLDGYINIDYPPTNHTVQKNQKVDEYSNLLELKRDNNSIDEIRLHHVFEHFDRPTALALLFVWNKWLKKNGKLRIEVPDYFWSGVISLTPIIPKKYRMIATRHIFGSHEAFWAIHCEGWTKSTLTRFLKIAGFKVIKVNRRYWKGTVNLEIISEKISQANFEKVESLFSDYLLDSSDSEMQMLKVWLEKFNQTVNQMTYEH